MSSKTAWHWYAGTKPELTNQEWNDAISRSQKSGICRNCYKRRVGCHPKLLSVVGDVKGVAGEDARHGSRCHERCLAPLSRGTATG